MSAEELPPLQSIALAYTPAWAAPVLRDVLAFDVNLLHAITRTKEPLLGQIRLAWWREQLALPAPQRAKGNPMLAALAENWSGESGALTALVDGWEPLLGPAPLEKPAILAFADGRAAAFAAIARLVGEAPAAETAWMAGQRWALADFATRVTNAQERERALELHSGIGEGRCELPRSLRGLALLDVLSRRALESNRLPMTRRSDALVAMRLGLLGR